MAFKMGARPVETVVVHESPAGPVLAVHYLTEYGESSGLETEYPVRWVDPLTGKPVPPGGTALARTPGDVPPEIAERVTTPVTALLAFPGEYPRVASAHQDAGDASLWDPSNGSLAATLPLPLPAMPVLIEYTRVDGAPYGPLIAGVTGPNEVVVRSNITGSIVSGPFQAHPGTVTSLQVLISADTRPVLVTTGTTPGSVLGPLPDLLRLWDPYTGAEIPLPGTTHCDGVAVVPRVSGGDLLAAGKTGWRSMT